MLFVSPLPFQVIPDAIDVEENFSKFSVRSFYRWLYTENYHRGVMLNCSNEPKLSVEIVTLLLPAHFTAI